MRTVLAAAAAVALLCAGHQEGCAMSTESTIYYVSTDGDDAWSGRLEAPNADRSDGPFATLARARDAIRALSAEERARAPITVRLRAGRYQLEEPLVFGPEDSGEPQAPITYEAYPGERPVISGGRPIAGWTTADGVVWSAPVPEAATGKQVFRQLFVNGRRAQRARRPSESFYEQLGEGRLRACPSRSGTFGAADPGPARVDDERALGFFHAAGRLVAEQEGARVVIPYHEGDINPAWAERGDVEVVVITAWSVLRAPILSVDEEARTVTVPGPGFWPFWMGWEEGERYWIENAPDALDAPGEWRLDRAAGEVRYRPRPGEDMERAEVIAPTLGELVRLSGDPGAGRLVHHLRFRGLTFAHTDWTLPPGGHFDMQASHDVPAAFSAEGATAVSIEQCRFEHLGGYAISFGRGCQRNAIIGSELRDLGAGGIKIGEPVLRDPEAEHTRDNLIADNHIHDTGRVYPPAVGIWVGQSAGNTIARNHIHDTCYSAMSVGWTWGYGPTLARDNIIEHNHVHDIGRGILSDLAGIYTLGVQPGTVIRHNLFHDISAQRYGGWGIYLDEGSSDILVENNLVFNTTHGGFCQHYGERNLIRNNIFALGRYHQLWQGGRPDQPQSHTFQRNIVYWREGTLLGGDWTSGDYRYDHNLYFDASGGPLRFGQWSLEEWRARGQDVNSVVADPLFRDPAAGDFRLAPDSPALTLGFQPFTAGRAPEE